VSALPADFRGENTGADIHVAPGGRFLYCSNRGHDSVAAFRIDGRAGTLTPAGHEPTRGRTPRNFAIDPTGNFLLAANQNSDTINVFRLDTRTGKLDFTGHALEVPAPVCLKLVAPFS
jgi:6-phosphogluconolactonase